MDDYERETVIYFLLGDNHQQFKDSLEIIRPDYFGLENVHCVSAVSKEKIDSSLQAFRSKAKQGSKYLIVDDLEKVQVDDIRNLDFMFRLADRTNDISGLSVLLLSDYSILPKNIPSPSSIQLREVVSERFHSVAHNFNGIAFAGRISQFQISETESMVTDVVSLENINVCDNIHQELSTVQILHVNPSKSIIREYNQDYHIVTLDSIYSILACLMFPFLFFLSRIGSKRMRD
jgi:hypothetical protein